MDYKLGFSINLYNSVGESYEDCILLHLNNGVILSFKDIQAYDSFIEQMQDMKSEINEAIADSNI